MGNLKDSMYSTKHLTCEVKPNVDRLLALTDAIELLSGKWKIAILRNLYHHKTLRFKDLIELLDGITPKVLSNDLQQLEENYMVVRTVNTTKPISVSYSLTAHALETQPVIHALIDFGLKHRKKIKD